MFVCLLVTSDIPDVEFEAIVHEGFDVEALGWHDLSDVLIRQLLQDGCLA